MGGVLTLGATAADLVNFGQALHSYRRQDLWSKRGYDISLQSMRIDILNTVREEMRDQVTVIVSSLDNLMVVATLMLSIGFGFVVEGTFPPPEDVHEYAGIEQFFLVLYAVLCALSLVFPLACLMLTIAARFEVELCQQDVMGDLQKHLLKALTRDQDEKGPERDSIRRSISRRTTLDSTFDANTSCCLPLRRSRSGPSLRGRSQSRLLTLDRSEVLSTYATPESRRASKAEQPDDVRRATSGLRKHIGSLFDGDQLGHVVESDVREIADGLQQKVKYYKWLYDIAQVFLWLGMISAVTTCSVLLGLFFRANYPETVWVWRFYSGILAVCALASIVFLIWMRSCMLAQPRKKIRERKETRDLSAVWKPQDIPRTAEDCMSLDYSPPAAWNRSDRAAAPTPSVPVSDRSHSDRSQRESSKLLLGGSSAQGERSRGLPRAAACHVHPLVLTPATERFSAWRCDGCSTKFNVLGGSGRFRCADGCDFDLCDDCHRLAPLHQADQEQGLLFAENSPAATICSSTTAIRIGSKPQSFENFAASPDKVKARGAEAGLPSPFSTRASSGAPDGSAFPTIGDEPRTTSSPAAFPWQPGEALDRALTIEERLRELAEGLGQLQAAAWDPSASRTGGGGSNAQVLPRLAAEEIASQTQGLMEHVSEIGRLVRASDRSRYVSENFSRAPPSEKIPETVCEAEGPPAVREPRSAHFACPLAFRKRLTQLVEEYDGFIKLQHGIAG